VLVEEDRDTGWSPAADTKDIETTPTKLRWHVRAAKGQTAKAELALERTDQQVVTLTTLSAEDMLVRIRGLENEGPALKEAVARLADVVADISRAKTQKTQIDAERKKIADDQERIRKNLASAGQSSDLGRRYLDTLRQQEDRLGELQKTDTALDEAIAQKRKAAEEIARRLKF
jgi:chromosome segregation ATPase